MYGQCSLYALVLISAQIFYISSKKTNQNFYLNIISILEDGDVYVWGWNESGQLGLPCQNCKTNIPTSEENVLTKKHQSGSAEKCNLYNDISISDLESRDMMSPQCGGFTKTEDKSVHGTDQSDGTCHHQSDACIGQKCQDHKNVLKSKILRQDIEAVQVQSIPCVLDLVDDVIVKDVSCGSRHTAFVTGNLLTINMTDSMTVKKVQQTTVADVFILILALA